MTDLPKPQTDTDVLLLAMIQRLDRVVELLTPAAVTAEVSATPAPEPKPARKRAASKQQ